MKLSIIIIHYKAPEMVNTLIKSCLTDGLGYALEFCVIDNSGNFILHDDNSKADINIISPGYNSGFARGVNAGLRAATGDYIVVINQDAYLYEKNTLQRLVTQHQQLPSKTISGCRLLDENGTFQQSIWTNYPTLSTEWEKSTFHSLLGKKKNKPLCIIELHKKTGYVERINGAFLLFHRNMVDTEKLFWDEDFFLYGEDVEWAWRCNHTGWKFYHNSTVSLTHFGSASSPNTSTKNLQVLLSDFLFVAKTHYWFYTLFFLIFVLTSSRFDLFLIERNFQLSEEKDVNMWVNRKMKVYLVKKYWRQLLGNHKHNDSEKFLFNCYENDQAFAATLSNQG